MFDYHRKIKVLLTKMNINTVNKQLEFSNKILLYGYNSKTIVNNSRKFQATWKPLGDLQLLGVSWALGNY